MMRKDVSLRWLLVSCCLVLAATAARAGNWPRFRGPNGTGIASDKNIPVTWSAADGILWKTHLPGAGNSSPVVWGNRLFIQSATRDERSLLCVNVQDGAIAWQRSLPGAVARIHPKSSFASSTPATDGKLVYAAFWDGDKVAVRAFDLKGKPIWKTDLEGSFRSQHGYGASPIVCGDMVILNNDQDGAATLYGLKASTGKIAWSVNRKAFRACYSTPFLLPRREAKPELIVSSSAGIAGYDSETGTENWSWTWTFSAMALRTVGSAVYGHGMIFANSGDGSGERNMVAVKAGGTGDVAKTSFVWGRKRNFPYVPSMLIWGDHLYWVNDHGLAGCTVAKTGKNVWTERLPGGGVSASPIIIDGKIYAATENGAVYVFPAAASFKLLAKNSMGEGVMATPAVANNRLFIRGDTHLFCIGKKSAK